MGFALEGQIAFGATFLWPIKSDDVPTATNEGKTEAFTLADIKEAAGLLLAMCGRDR